MSETKKQIVLIVAGFQFSVLAGPDRMEPKLRMDVFYSKCMHVEMNVLCPPCLGTSS